MNARDDLFARVLRRLDMVDEAELDKALADFEAHEGEGLGQFLLDNELIPQKIKLTVELSLPAEIIEAPPAVETSPPTPAPDPPAQDSSTMAAVVREKMSDGAKKVYERRKWKPKARRSKSSGSKKQEADTGGLSASLQSFLRYYVSSRADLALIEHLSKQNVRGGVFSPKGLAPILGQTRKELSAISKAMCDRGLVREVGTETFNFAPSKKVQDQLVELQRANRDPKKRSAILAAVLKREK